MGIGVGIVGDGYVGLFRVGAAGVVPPECSDGSMRVSEHVGTTGGISSAEIEVTGVKVRSGIVSKYSLFYRKGTRPSRMELRIKAIPTDGDYVIFGFSGKEYKYIFKDNVAGVNKSSLSTTSPIEICVQNDTINKDVSGRNLLFAIMAVNETMDGETCWVMNETIKSAYINTPTGGHPDIDCFYRDTYYLLRAVRGGENTNNIHAKYAGTSDKIELFDRVTSSYKSTISMDYQFFYGANAEDIFNNIPGYVSEETVDAQNFQAGWGASDSETHSLTFRAPIFNVPITPGEIENYEFRLYFYNAGDLKATRYLSNPSIAYMISDSAKFNGIDDMEEYAEVFDLYCDNVAAGSTEGGSDSSISVLNGSNAVLKWRAMHKINTDLINHRLGTGRRDNDGSFHLIGGECVQASGTVSWSQLSQISEYGVFKFVSESGHQPLYPWPMPYNTDKTKGEPYGHWDFLTSVNTNSANVYIDEGIVVGFWVGFSNTYSSFNTIKSTPYTRLSSPTGFHTETTEGYAAWRFPQWDDAVFKWDAVNGATGYQFELYTADYVTLVTGIYTTQTSVTIPSQYANPITRYCEGQVIAVATGRNSEPSSFSSVTWGQV